MGMAQHDQTDELKKLYADIHKSLTPLAATASSMARRSGDGRDITRDGLSTLVHLPRKNGLRDDRAQ